MDWKRGLEEGPGEGDEDESVEWGLNEGDALLEPVSRLSDLDRVGTRSTTTFLSSPLAVRIRRGLVVAALFLSPRTLTGLSA